MSIRSFAVVFLSAALLTPVAALAGDEAGSAKAAPAPMEHHGRGHHHRHHHHRHHHHHGGHMGTTAEDPGHTGNGVHPTASPGVTPH